MVLESSAKSSLQHWQPKLGLAENSTTADFLRVLIINIEILTTMDISSRLVDLDLVHIYRVTAE